jgi:hypothetical protein
MHAKPTSKTCIASFCLLGALVFTAAGCVIEVDDPIVEPLYFNDMADMEVRWSINGSTDPIWCNDLGIETWLVELSGRDAQDVYVDCRGDFWDTGSALYGLTEGDYRVRLTALDFDDISIVTVGARVDDVYDDGGVDVIDFNLDDREF